MKNKLLIATFCSLLLVGLLGVCLLPKQTVSREERRTLRSFPTVTRQGVLSGEWMRRFDEWLPDRFPLREPLRRAALGLRVDVLRQTDYKGAFTADGRVVQTTYPLNQKAVLQLADKTNALSRSYFTNANVFFALVPDKAAYLAAAHGRLSLDFDGMERLLYGSITSARCLSLKDALTAADYYDTDIHWRQERLQGVVDTLGAAMGFTPPALDAMERNVREPFYGASYSKGTRVLPDRITTLENAVIEAAIVENVQKPAVKTVYDEAAFFGMDGYDVFLSGATPFLTIANAVPAAAARGRTLIMMRDSFASSLAPLLTPAYETIVLVDLRYLSSDLLGDMIPPVDAKTDVLFLYGVQVANSEGILR